MAQSPLIAIPKKSTDEVDWTGPIRAIIKQSYGENPDNYASECASLQRCRQDAVRGAGSDVTAASLLTKYFGQLELLELRFAEIRVSFPWRDAFTSKLTTQTSMAYEKASIIYQIAATHSAISSAQNRSDPEGLKRAYYYSRTCAGMLTYINDNFLHAPSTDLSREVIKFLVGITLAQANEIFYETTVDKRQSPGLMSKVAANASALYNGLCEEVKEFFGKGIFDRNWVTLLQIKARYFTSLMHYQRSLADTAAGKHGEALSRLQVAETNAKEAHKLASSFSPYFVTTLSTTLPSDTGSAILELMKNHVALCTEKRTQGQKDNDLIYNAPVPAEATLPIIDKINAVTPIPIQEVYGTPEVQKTIGPDLFAKLIPLSVHEGASVYSEEKAKIVRAEVEKADMAESEARAALASLGVKTGLGRFKEIVEGEVQEGVPPTVLSWQEEIKRREGEGGGVEKRLAELEWLKANVASKLDSINVELANETRECETMRVKYGHKWTQEPSGGLSKDVRNGLKDHRASLEAAAPSDQQVHGLWQSVKGDIGILLNTSQLESLFASAANGSSGGGSLLDVEPDTTDDTEREKMRKLVAEIEERLGRINKIARERNEILKDLKEKVQNDDVSHLLLLNKRNTGMEPTLFANELEKFRPYQTRLASANHAQQMTIQEIASLWKSLKDKGTKGKGAKRWEERERRFNELIKRFALAREGYMEILDGAMKGIQFYRDLTSLSDTLHSKGMAFVSARTRERESLAGKLAVEMRLESPGLQTPQSPVTAPSLPPPPPRPGALPTATPASAPGGTPVGHGPVRSGTLDGAFASMSLGGLPSAPSAPPGSTSLQRPPGHAGYTSPPPPHVSSPYGTPSAPAPPPPSTASPYGGPPQPQQAYPPPPPSHQHQGSISSQPYQYQHQPPLQASSPFSPPPQPQHQYTQPQPPVSVPASTQPQSPPQPPIQPLQSNSMFPPPPPPAQTVDPYAGMFGAGSPFGSSTSTPAPSQATQPGWGAPTITNTNSGLPPPPAPIGQNSWTPSPPPPPQGQGAAYGNLQGLYQQPGPAPAPAAPPQHMGGYPGAYGHQPSHPSHSHSYSQSQIQPYGSAQPVQNPYANPYQNTSPNAGSPYGQPPQPQPQPQPHAQAGYGFPPPPPPTQQNYQYPR